MLDGVCGVKSGVAMGVMEVNLAFGCQADE